MWAEGILFRQRNPLQMDLKRRLLAGKKIGTPTQPTTVTARLNVRRFALRLVLTSVFPLLMGLLADSYLGTFPSVTIVVGPFSIALGLWFVLRPAIAEFQRLTDQIAPQVEDDRRLSPTKADADPKD